MRTGRRVTTVAASMGLVVVTGLALLVVGGIVGRGTESPAPATAPASTVDMLDQSITRTQERLRRVPGDWQAWSALSMQYLERARITTDPTYYPKAEEAVRRSLDVRPHENTDAMVALGALANARHDFAAAREHARAAIALNVYSSEAYAVLADAETQLGNRSRRNRGAAAAARPAAGTLRLRTSLL